MNKLKKARSQPPPSGEKRPIWGRGEDFLIFAVCVLLGVAMMLFWLWGIALLTGYCMGVEGCV